MNTLKQTKTTVAALLACVVFIGLIVARFVYAPKSAADTQPVAGLKRLRRIVALAGESWSRGRRESAIKP